MGRILVWEMGVVMGVREPWQPPVLVPIAAGADARNALNGTGNVDQTYQGFPYGYSGAP